MRHLLLLDENSISPLRDKISGASGAVLIEAAYTVMFLLVMIAGTFEFGRALTIYQTLANAAYQAARAGSQLPLPQVGCYGSFLNMDQIVMPTDTELASHAYMARIARLQLDLASREHARDLFPPGIDDGAAISTRYVAQWDDPAVAGNCSDSISYTNTIGVRIEREIDLFFLPISIPVRAEVSIPFLFNTQRYTIPQVEQPDPNQAIIDKCLELLRNGDAIPPECNDIRDKYCHGAYGPLPVIPAFCDNIELRCQDNFKIDSAPAECRDFLDQFCEEMGDQAQEFTICKAEDQQVCVDGFKIDLLLPRCGSYLEEFCLAIPEQERAEFELCI